MKSLWRYNKITGYWVLARPSGYDDTMKNWLRIYQADEPNEYFRLSIRRPRYNPTKKGKYSLGRVERRGRVIKYHELVKDGNKYGSKIHPWNLDGAEITMA